MNQRYAEPIQSFFAGLSHRRLVVRVRATLPLSVRDFWGVPSGKDTFRSLPRLTKSAQFLRFSTVCNVSNSEREGARGVCGGRQCKSANDHSRGQENLHYPRYIRTGFCSARWVVPRTFVEVQREMEKAARRLQEATDYGVRRAILKEMSDLLKEADRITASTR